jgi:nucleotide-binding universal stress UspA family protein
MQSGPSRQTSTIRPFTIVVASDFEPASGYAFDLAAQMALRIPGSRLEVVHVVDQGTSDAEIGRLAGLLRLYVQEKSAADSYTGQSVGVHLRQGDKTREIAQLALDVSADAILLGPHTHVHLRDLQHGSPAARLQSDVSCPVLVAQPKPEPPPPGEPAIEPPCADCVAVRDGSGGSTWWCPRHDTAERRAHQYSYRTELPFATHDSAVLPVDLG